MKTTTLLTTALIAFTGFSLSSCKDSETSSATTAPASVELEKYFTDQEPSDAQDIHLARTTAKPGDEITLRGELMGRESVFVEDRAAFVLGDPKKLTSCDKIPGDSCPTPWDACCDSPELKSIGVASIQILGEDGRVLAGNLKGVNGMEELSDIVLKGAVAENSTAENFIVNAEQIYVTDK